MAGTANPSAGFLTGNSSGTRLWQQFCGMTRHILPQTTPRFLPVLFKHQHKKRELSADSL
jgi:hypothetical protein